MHSTTNLSDLNNPDFTVPWRLIPPQSLRANPRNARTHSKKQTRQIAKSIQRFGFTNPILVDETDMVLAGHGRLTAALFLGLDKVPALRIDHLSDAEKRAYVLADNKLAEQAGWDREILAVELGELSVLLPELECDVTITGFEIGEIDQLMDDRSKRPLPNANDDDPIPETPQNPVSRRGDLWLLGPHRLKCGDARSNDDLMDLMNGRKAHMAFLDPPYNVRVKGHVQGRGKVQHDEFAFASGEMSKTEFVAFLKSSLEQAVRASTPEALHYICMDWRHAAELMAAADELYASQVNLCVWSKTIAGQGSFYRSQHELVFVYKAGDAPHRNAIELGRYGRSRSNVWTYPGANSFKAGRRDELNWHPTVKPVALVADAMRDCTIKGDTVLDSFLGSGTTLMAAEKIGRVCYGLEYEPKYVDVAIQRWQNFTKLEAVCAVSGKTFDEVSKERSLDTNSESHPTVSPSAVDEEHAA